MLNEKQIEAVNNIKGPVLIIAGPGTGKTKTLVERVVNILVNEEIEAKKIILTTFTDKAARELEQRINEKLEEINVNLDISEMYIGTMHSIWIRFIEENIKYSNFFDGFELLTSNYEQHFFIYSRLKEYKQIEGYKEFFQNLSSNGNQKIKSGWEISRYLRNKINDLNENAISINEISSSDKYINFLKEAYALYEKQLFEANKMDFSYVQIEFYNMLTKNAELLKKLNEKIDFLMIDEYQDSNRIQQKIVFLLSKFKKNICVVGDEDQAIYRFRGATTENILNFPKYFPNECKIIVLNKNYRSVSDIVEFNNKWINHIDWKGNKYDKNIVSARTEDILNSNVLHIGGNSDDENIRNTVAFIKKLKASNKISNYSQVAILFATFKGNLAKKLEDSLKKEGINVFSPRTKVFFEMHEVKLTFGLILACFKKYISISDINTYLEECLALARLEAKKDKQLFEWIKNKIDNSDDINIDSLNDIFYELFQFQYYKNILDTENLAVSREKYNLSFLSKLFKNFQKYVFYKKIDKESNFSVVVFFFGTYMSILKKTRIDDLIDKEEYPDDCIPFLTIHQSKGLEFPVVIVFSLFSYPRIDNPSSRITSIDRLLNNNDSTEITEKDKIDFDFYRQFYVAFTRAKNLLVLSSNTKNLSKNFEPFFYSIPSVNSINFNLEELSLDKINEKKEKKVLSFTTDFTLYKFCPEKYKMIREEKFQNFEKLALNIGIIVHKTIEHINRRLINDPTREFSLEYIEKIVEKIYKFRKINLDENFNKIIYLVANYIEKEKENFKYLHKIEASEYKVEDEYIIYGQIDLILNKGNYLELIDFKTGKNKKENELSKTYREQLSLYKLLLQKKYPNKEIKAYLYYLEDNEKEEIEISETDLEADYLKIKELAKNILEQRFYKKEFNENTCLACEFKYYCYGEKIL